MLWFVFLLNFGVDWIIQFLISILSNLIVSADALITISRLITVIFLFEMYNQPKHIRFDNLLLIEICSKFFE